MRRWQQKLGTPDKIARYTVEELQSWPVPDIAILREYANAVRQKTLALLEAMPPEKLSEPLSPECPGTAGDMLGRMTTEIAMHVGQFAYLRGMQRGLDKQSIKQAGQCSPCLPPLMQELLDKLYFLPYSIFIILYLG